MIDTGAFIWPLLGFLSVAASASWWQAHSAGREIEAMERRFIRDRTSLEKQDEVRRFKRSRERRAVVLGALGLAVIVYVRLI